MPISITEDALQECIDAPYEQKELQQESTNHCTNSLNDPYREEGEKQAAEFVRYIINNPHEREKLEDATAAEIVQAGKDAGYHFTISDLNALLSQSIVPMPTMTSWAWDPTCNNSPAGG